MRVLSTGLVASLVALTPAMAQAHASSRCPVGNSGANQYREDIPTASGCRPSSGGRSHRSGSSRTLAPATARALRQQGQAGAQTALLAGATGPAGVHGAAPAGGVRRSGSKRHHRSLQASAGQNRSPGAPPPAASPASQLAKTLTGSSGIGLGLLLPVILIGIALVALAVSVLRRRRAA